VVIAREKNAWLSYPWAFERRSGELWVITRFTKKKSPGKIEENAPVCIKLSEADFVNK
jgi:hypothetical protein